MSKREWNQLALSGPGRQLDRRGNTKSGRKPGGATMPLRANNAERGYPPAFHYLDFLRDDTAEAEEAGDANEECVAMRTTRIAVLQSREQLPLVVRSRFERTWIGGVCGDVIGGGRLFDDGGAARSDGGVGSRGATGGVRAVPFEFFGGVSGSAAKKNANGHTRARREHGRATERPGANGLWPDNTPATSGEGIAEHTQTFAGTNARTDYARAAAAK